MGLLSQRRRRPEVMDQPELCPDRHARALRGLARLNFFSRSAGLLWPPLEAQSRRQGNSLRLLDVAAGGGDVPVRLWKRARRVGYEWHVAGCDRSPVAVEYARAHAARAGAEVHFFVHDALGSSPLPAADAATCSLFLHHLDDAQAVALLRALAEAAPLVLVNDLERGLAGLALAHVATRLLTTSGVVHTDGPRSVEGAFTLAEARALAERAGLVGATVERRWPCRWLLTWRRP